METDFRPGMLVAVCETWPTKRVITINTIATVGKRDIKLAGEKRDRYRLDGRTWDTGVYRWRAIRPLTKKLLAEAEANRVYNTGLALGHQLPDE